MTSTDLSLYSAFTNDVVPVQLIHKLGFSFIYKVWANMFDLLYCCGNLASEHCVSVFFAFRTLCKITVLKTQTLAKAALRLDALDLGIRSNTLSREYF